MIDGQNLFLARWVVLWPGIPFFLCLLVYCFYVSWKYEGKGLTVAEISKLEIKTILIFTFIFGAVLIVNLFFPEKEGYPFLRAEYIIIVAAFLFMVTWFRFLRKSDIFEKDNLRYSVLVLVAGMGLAFVAPPVTRLLSETSVVVNGDIANDFVYSVACVGLVKETLKMLPVFALMTLSTRVINEAYDYILYACMSALGFSFVENVQLALTLKIDAVHSLLMYSVVAHMFFTSIAAYGIVLYKYQPERRGNLLLHMVVFLFLAGTTHGFYEFWHVNEYVHEYQVASAIFILGSVYIWCGLRNNALNNSEFFNESAIVNLNHQQGYLALALTCIYLLEYIGMAWLFGSAQANSAAFSNAMHSIFIIGMFSVNSSFIKLKKGAWFPVYFTLSQNIVHFNECEGYEVEITCSPYNLSIARALPLSGKIEGRVDVSGARPSKLAALPNAWVTRLHTPHIFISPVKEYLIIELYSPHSILRNDKKVMASLFLFRDIQQLEKRSFKRNELQLVGWTMVQQVVVQAKSEQPAEVTIDDL